MAPPRRRIRVRLSDYTPPASMALPAKPRAHRHVYVWVGTREGLRCRCACGDVVPFAPPTLVPVDAA
jgi:hypothetical protein